MRRLASVPAGAVVAALVALSTVLRFWAASRVHTPWITPDEAIYGELAQSLYRSGSFELLGRPAEFLSLVYPALVGPLLALDDLERGYRWTQLLQALVMSLTAVPVYLWTRSLASRGWALAAAALTLTVPGLAYSGLLMTEVAFYPAIVLAALAMARALERPTPVRQAAMVAAVGLAALTRLQAFALVPVFVTALALKLALERRPRTAVVFSPALAGLVLLGLGWAAWRLRHGGPLSRVFAGYEPAGQVDYGVADAARFALYHAGDVLVLSGLYPVCAVALLLAAGERSEAARSYLAVAVSLVAWFAVEVGVFASRHVGYLAERNLLPLAPVLFVGFAAWLDRGAPRPRGPTALVAAGALLLLAALPVGRLVSPAAFPDAFTLLPLVELEERRPGADLDLLLTAGAAVALLVLALVPRRALVVLPLAVGAALAGISVWTSAEMADRAAGLQAASTGPERRWIDRRATGPVALLYLGELNWPGVWENLFWSRRVDRVYDLLEARVPGGLPQDSVGPLEDGRLVLVNGRPAEARYVVAAYPVTFAGRALATAGDGLVLWRLDPPFRLSVWTQRVEGHVRVLAYGCPGGRLALTLRARGGAAVELRRSDRPFARVDLSDDEVWTGSVPARPNRPGGLCTFDVLGPVAVERADFLRAKEG